MQEEYMHNGNIEEVLTEIKELLVKTGRVKIQNYVRKIIYICFYKSSI